MKKNIFLLTLLTWVSFSYSKHPVVKEQMDGAQSYKVEKPVAETKPGRSFAGARAKKEKKWDGKELERTELPSESDSEVRYWRYSE